MAEHIAEQWAACPAIVAKFALTTGQESDMEMARGMIARNLPRNNIRMQQRRSETAVVLSQ
ncbi:hypothetical protein [Paenibacillus sp.]|uniref:hypothetical protein n=1 Tax=Paenibacillus sp. TaxID=58172 RepID=UPI0035C87924